MPSGKSILKIVCILSYFTVWWTIYEITNRHGCAPGMAASFVRPVDQTPGIIQPWTALIYVFGGAVLPLVPFFFYWTWPKLRLVLGSYAITSALAFTCYWLWPVTIVRPSYDGAGMGRWLMRQVVSVDGAANCNPSSHVFYAVLAALFVVWARPNRVVCLVVCALAAAVAVTTVTTGQHYWIDIAGGTAAALAGYVIGQRIFHRAA